METNEAVVIQQQPQPQQQAPVVVVYNNNPNISNNTQTVTAATTQQIGESEYGERLNYAKKEYKDLWAMILFYLHILLIIIFTIIFWASILKDATFKNSSYNNSLTGIWVTFGIALFVAILSAFIWLYLMKYYAIYIIKVLLFLNLLTWFTYSILNYFDCGLGCSIVTGVIFICFAIYSWVIWVRIPFASVCLTIACTIIAKYTATILICLFVTFINCFWFVIWLFFIIGYFVYVNDTNAFVVLLSILALYWSIEVWKTVIHTTSCGVSATWYFNKTDDLVNSNPTLNAFHRCMTSSFGSVCFGALIVAIVHFIRKWLLGCCARCCFCCYCCIYYLSLMLEKALSWFNLYAFAHVSIYGSSYIQSGKKTYQLLKHRGIWAFVNDSVIGVAMLYSSCIAGIICAITGYLISYGFYETDYVSWLFAVCCFYFGYYICRIILSVIQSSVISLFVCFAEDPKAMELNHNQSFQDLCNANHMMQNVATGQYHLNHEIENDGPNQNNTQVIVMQQPQQPQQYQYQQQPQPQVQYQYQPQPQYQPQQPYQPQPQQ